MKQLAQNVNGQQKIIGGKYLVPTSQPNKTDPLLIIEGQLRESYGRLVYTHKTHEKCSDILLSRLSSIKISQIILSAVTTGGLVTALFGAEKIGVCIGIVFSTLLLVLNSYNKNYDLGELAQKHKQAANDLWLIRERYISLITDLKLGNLSIEKIQQRRDELTEELHQIYAGTPCTTYRAYKKAQQSLKEAEEMTFSDAEIDQLLPSKLRIE
jgi:hypothetical protein